MPVTRMTSTMRRSLERRLEELEARIAQLDEDREAGDGDTTALKVQLARERSQIADALRDMTLIDDAPFDTGAIEVGDLVTIRGQDGDVERYVLVDDGVGARARSDWVSVGSPLGGAILGRSLGDEVGVVSPEGTLSFVILAFERASGDDPAVVSVNRPSPQSWALPSEAFLG